MTSNTCLSCGREMAKDMMFCPYCGSKIQAEGSLADAGEQERIEGVIPLAKWRGETDQGTLSTLVITSTSVIIAKVKETDSDKIRKATGSLFMGGANLDPERHRKSLGAYSSRYLTMDPGTILAESSSNESIRITDVKAVRISSEDDSEGDQYYILAIETDRGIRTVQIPADRDSRDLIISTFGPKVHW